MLKDGVPKSIVDKLAPYVHHTGEDAQKIIDENKDHLPTLTSDEGELISDIYMKQTIDIIATEYNKENNTLTFSQIPYNTRTAIVDLAYNYGPHLWLPSAQGGTPAFWDDIVSHNWQKAQDELMNFGDKNPGRRKKEGDLVNIDIINNSFYR